MDTRLILRARLLRLSQRPPVVRGALLLSLAIAWVNFLGTVKWAGLPGALNGWKRPWYGAALLVATLAAPLPWRGRRPLLRLRLVWILGGIAGAAALLFVLFSVFPPDTWSKIPFQDDWPPRFQSTLDGIDLLRRGAVNGWQWNFMGGYHTSSNLSQPLTIVSFLPVTLFGPAIGFHVLHAVMVVLLPLLVFWELRQEGDRDLALLGGAFALFAATGLFGTIVPSGDTNSIAGLVCASTSLAASHAARLGRRWGWPLLVLGLSVTLYAHAAFFLYAAGYLLLESIYYRDLRCAVRSGLSLGVAVLVGTPLFWELLRYPSYTSTNNIAIPGATPPYPYLRQVYYNVEMLVQPHRWFNDYIGLTVVFLPLLLVVGFGRRHRAGFYALCAVATLALMRLDAVQLGYLLIRESHMLAFFAPPALAAFVVWHARRPVLAVALAAVIGLYVQTNVEPVTHVTSVSEFNPALVEEVARLDGHLVLMENNPHRNMDVEPGRRSVRSPFPVHAEALLPAATGKRFYGSEWDGWVWSSYRMQIVAGGTFAGHAIASVPPSVFIAELHRWGIRNLVVWSEPTTRYLSGLQAFSETWAAPPWRVFELRDADVRSVVTATGTGILRNRDPLGAEVALSGVRRGDTVLVRMNFYPAWRASWEGRDIALRDEGGQLAFTAPADGDAVVHLEYPAHRPLNAALLLLLVAAVGLASVPAIAGAIRPAPAG